MKPIFTRSGGKTRMLPHLTDWLPAKPKCFVEPFCGGASLLLSRPKQPRVQEVLNDTNADIINVFRCARFHAEELVRNLEFRPRSLVEFKSLQTSQPLTDIQRAADWLLANWFSFGGQGVDNGFGWTRSRPRGTHSKMLRIRELAARLDSVILDSRDYEACLKTFDSPYTFFFVDPPYLYGDCEYMAWTEKDFKLLRGSLDALRGSWVLTTSAHAAMREIFKGCEIREVERQRGISNNRANSSRYKELIIRKEGN